MQKTDEELLVIWREKIATDGISVVRANADSLDKLANGRDYYVSRAAIKEYEEKQEDERAFKRDEREKETLKLAKEANQIAKDTKKEMRYTWAGAVIIGILTIFFSIILAEGGNAP